MEKAEHGVPSDRLAKSTPGHIPFAKVEVSSEAVTAANRVLRSGWLTSGPEVVEFEREFATYLGAEHAVAVSSCTAAIEIALRAMRLAPGARVLTPTVNFCGVLNAIVAAGHRPVLVDVDRETLAASPETVSAAARRSDSEAMVVLHYAGYPVPVEDLGDAAGLGLERVVEDAAHALGASVGDETVGTISAATCFSFYATKNLPIGEGGMLVTADPDMEEFARRARLHGMSRDAWQRYSPGQAWRYAVETEGLKANMTDVQAAIGRAHLKRLPDWQVRREEIAHRYDVNLSEVPGVRLPARPATGRHAWHLYVVQLESRFGVTRDQAICDLAERGIDCSVHFIPLHQQPYVRTLLGDDVATGFPGADRVFEGILSLPMYPGLTDEEVDRVCEATAELSGRGRTVDRLAGAVTRRGGT
jgi:perosamine synthetase